ncbi:MAG TPA: hypothetical protein VEB20_07175 [Azospirillaceae bacterium]|nr:hypothetical protein [Azospirillaceae bacterium]
MDVLLVRADALAALSTAGQLSRAGHRAKAIAYGPETAIRLARDLRFGGAVLESEVGAQHLGRELTGELRRRGVRIVWVGGAAECGLPDEPALGVNPTAGEIEAALAPPRPVRPPAISNPVAFGHAVPAGIC